MSNIIVKGDFYVAPNGNDENVGSEAAPFASIFKARDELRKTHGGTVCIKSGEYDFHNGGITFDSRDSGTKYVAYGDGEVIFNGGITLNPNDFKPVNDDIKARLSDEVKEKVLCADLTAYGLTSNDWGKIHAVGAFNTASKYDDSEPYGTNCEIFFNNKRMTLARYPNENEFLKLADVLDVGDVAEFPPHNYFHDWENRRNHRGGTYIIDKATNEHLKGWKSYDDVWMFGYFFWDWADSSTPVKEINTSVRTIKPEYVSRYAARRDALYYFFNILEELDSPGEWYLDRVRGLLYIYPTSDMADAEIDISIINESIIMSDKADNMVFDGLTLKCTRRDAFIINADCNIIRRCYITNVLGNAISVNGINNLVSECEITHTGKGGIILNGGDRLTLTKGNNKADNNFIHDWSEVYLTYQPAVSLSGVGNICSHNEIYNSPQMAINYSGNDHLIEYNLIHDVVLQSTDGGAIYAGCDWTAQGSILRYNALYNIGSGQFKPDGIYWDDSLSGQTAYGNVLVNIAKNAFLIGGGRDNTVKGNLIINPGENGISYDDRARDGFVNGGWAKESVNSTDSILWRRLRAVPFRSNIWAEKYPALSIITEDFNDYDNPNFPINPTRAIIEGNIIYDNKSKIGSICNSVYKYGTVRNNSVCPLVTDFPNDSILHEIISDFEPIPYNKIGRYKLEV